MKMSSTWKNEASIRIWAFKNGYVTIYKRGKCNEPAFPCQMNPKLA